MIMLITKLYNVLSTVVYFKVIYKVDSTDQANWSSYYLKSSLPT